MQTPHCYLDRGEICSQTDGTIWSEPNFLSLSPTTVFFLLYNGYVSAALQSVRPEFWHGIVNIVYICNNS